METLLRRNETLPSGIRTRLYALVRDEGKARRRFAAYEGRSDLSHLVQDVSEPVVGGERFDFLIHAASSATPKRYATHLVDTIAANVSGTRNVLERARADGASGGVLFLSSGEGLRADRAGRGAHRGERLRLHRPDPSAILLRRK